MDIVIIGLPQSGKTTLFDALTLGKSDASGASGSPTEMHIGMVKVPDRRLDHLGAIYNPRKIVPAEIRYTDLPGPEGMARSQGISGRYRNILQSATAFLVVVRAFQNDSVSHPTGAIDPARDLEAMLGELSFADLEVLERARMEEQDGSSGFRAVSGCPGMFRYPPWSPIRPKLCKNLRRSLSSMEWSVTTPTWPA